LALERRDTSPVIRYRLLILSQDSAGLAQVESRYPLEGDITERLGAGKGPLTTHQGALLVARSPEILAEIGGDLPQAALVAERLGEHFGLAEGVEHRPVCCEGKEHLTQVEPEIDRLLQRRAALWQMRESLQRLLDVCHCLPVGRVLGHSGA